MRFAGPETRAGATETAFGIAQHVRAAIEEEVGKERQIFGIHLSKKLY